MPDDGETIWTINNTFSDLDSKADSWLEKAFCDVSKLKSVEVTATKAEDSWTASRPNVDANEFTLDGAKPGEKLDNGKVSLGSLLSSPTFNDVLAKDKAAATMKDAVKAKLVTFEGFTYNVQAVKQAGKDGSGDKYYLTLAVSADIAKERAPVKDEKAEDKKKNDDAFAEEKKKKEEKLAAEKKLEGWVYEVSEYTVSNLLKKRAEILAEPEKPTTGDAPASGLPDVKKMLQSVPAAPAPAPVPVATPPVPVPSLSTPSATPLPEAPKTEIKPAPAPGSNPVTGKKSVEPAKPAAEAAKK
jgi:hypothetical protein